MSHKQHIQYIDVLKGVTIFLVVVGHAFHFGFEYYRSPLLYVLRSIDMPIFLFLSGMLGAKALSFEGQDIKAYWLKKARQLLLPLCTLPFLYASIYNIDIVHLLLDRMHGGYWFTLTLFEMFVLLYVVRYLNHRFNTEQKPLVEGLIALISLVFVLAIDRPWMLLHPTSWEALSWGKMNYLYYYFLFGYFVGKHTRLEELISSQAVQLASACVFTFCIYQECKGYIWLERIPASFSGLIMAYATAKRLGGVNTRFNRFWVYLGKESRTIYLTHFFFLFTAPTVGQFLKDFKGAKRIFLYEAGAAAVYALLVIGATLLLVRLIKSNDYLNTLCYGKQLPKRTTT